jgi:UDP-glucose 4-epimerase
MTWMVTGGAGYIGAHVVRALVASGREVIVVDNLSRGLARKVPPGVTLLELDVDDSRNVLRAVRRFSVEGVIHLAAQKAVAESVMRPLHYYLENLHGLITLAQVMVEAGVQQMVYSSSAAVYGSPDSAMVLEESPTHPSSPYGETKLVGEWILRDAVAAHGMSVTALRYFNVVGAGAPDLGDDGTENLVPRVLRAVSQGVPIDVFGTDYPTPDGTGVRDYVHVSDLAEAHVAAAAAMGDGRSAFEVYNVGCGRGYSVREVIDGIADVTGSPVQVSEKPRRPGDAASVVADVSQARTRLGWSASRDLHDMLESSWRAHLFANESLPVA